jgi:hypothetical protein
MELLLLQNLEVLQACFKVYKAKDKTRYLWVEHWVALLESLNLLGLHTGLDKFGAKVRGRCRGWRPAAAAQGGLQLGWWRWCVASSGRTIKGALCSARRCAWRPFHRAAHIVSPKHAYAAAWWTRAWSLLQCCLTHSLCTLGSNQLIVTLCDP